MQHAYWKPEDLINWRKRVGWTQRYSAEQLGMTRGHYQRMEIGRVGIMRTTQLACMYLESTL